jgi:hypothetical protein
MNREAFEKWYKDFTERDYNPTGYESDIAQSAWQAASNKAIESLASWMLMRGFSTGHGDKIDDLLAELGGQIDDLLSAGKETK